MKKILSLLTFLVMPLLALAHNGDSVKYELIRTTVDFLAADKTSFPESKGNPSGCAYSNYGCLRSFAISQKLLPEETFKTWREYPCRSIGDANAIKGKLLAAASKSTAGTDALSKRMNSIAASFSDAPVTAPETAAPTTTDTPASTAAVPPAAPPATTTADSGTAEAPETPLPAEEDGPGLLLIGAAIAALLALVLSIYAVMKNGRANEAPHLRGRENTAEETELLRSRIDKLESQLAQLTFPQLAKGDAARENPAVTDKLAKLEKRILALEDLPRTFDLSIPPPTTPVEPAATAATAAAAIPSPVKSPGSQRLYAKMPDMQNGFSDGVLQELQNGEQIYQLDIRGDKGSFEITTDAGAQKFALADYQYYLDHGCTFTNTPSKDSRITTVQPGILLRASNGWAIDKKAVIAFS